jgi:topoisomerase-4 subunit A
MTPFSDKLKSYDGEDHVVSLDGMYEEYFLDYASYVILERAVPAIEDGLKPVQRRILYSLKEKDDGRFHKVANIIGHTMQYHPHGDAAIGDALVNLGQKDLLIDTQGNWGDIRTGDSAAASRYIEARLTKFALEILFNKQTTQWQLSYDGRNQEPITLPVKFPLVLVQGVDGIAVGLSTKILPHNFIELIRAAVKYLEGKKFKLYPDFLTGGAIDVSEYNGGKRGGKVKVRGKVEIKDKSTLLITELPYGVTTSSLIDSVIKASDKGQIKIKRIVDNTAKEVEIQVDLPSGVSPEVTTDALYAFTDCEVSISPNACIIIDNKPHFLRVEEILRISVDNTKHLLGLELEIRKKELEQKWHHASLERIFIENRIYRDIEEAESFEEALSIIHDGLKKYVITPGDQDGGPSDPRIRLMREITEEDLIKLTEIKIKRISKYNKFKHEEMMASLLEELDQVNYDIDHLVDYTISYFETLLEKYGKGRERRTEITSFDVIRARKVVANNAKLYVDRKEGFIGTGLKKDEFISECSDIDDIVTFNKDGCFQVSRIGDKVFVGKNILHAAVWKKGDERTTYNLIYLDGKTGRAMAKRFNVSAITRDKSYDLTKGHKGSKVLYFTANPNGESETVQVTLSPGCSAKKKVFEFDFAEIAIKGRGSQGNIVTKYPVRKIAQLEMGKSTLGAMKIWMDEVSGRLNKDGRGKFLGEFDTGHQVLVIYKDGTYEVKDPELETKLEADRIMEVGRLDKDTVVSVIYFEGEKGWTMVKRFQIETSKAGERFNFLSETPGTKLYYASVSSDAEVSYVYKAGRERHEKELNLREFIDIKGWKALGNKLGEFKVLSVKSKADNLEEDVGTEKVDEVKSDKPPGPTNEAPNGTLKPGDTIELDF